MYIDRYRRVHGFTLIELIMFIVIVGASVGGIMAAFSTTVKSSADPMIRKQLISVAEALMSEITLHPFTYCDPNDSQVRYANAASVGVGNCATTVEGVGAESGETRINFDNVSDYHAPSATAITDVNGAAISLLAGYTSSITITQVGGGAGTLASLPNSAVLEIVVTVSRGSESITLTGYRFRHSPNSAG